MSIPAWARKGAKVVCVPYMGADRLKFDGSADLAKGEIVTLRVVKVCSDGFVAVGLVEAPGPIIRGIEALYRLRNFRPLISQADDISTHFQALLSTPVKKEEDA